MTIPVFRGEVTDEAEPQMLLEARGLFRAWLGKLKGKRIALTIEEHKPPKSQSQIGYWHGVLMPLLAEEFGYGRWEHDAVHDAVMRKLRGEHGPLKARLSMAKMSKPDVSKLIDDCRAWALTDYGIVSPDPEPDARKRAATAA